MIRPSANKSLSVALASLLMLSGASVAAAQATMSKDSKATTGSAGTASSKELKLTSDQEKKLWTEISSNYAMKQNAPSGFNAAVGETLPASVTLRELPSKAQTEVPAAQPYHYAMVQDKLLLVNPSDKKIVDVITK